MKRLLAFTVNSFTTIFLFLRTPTGLGGRWAAENTSLKSPA